MNKTIDLIVKGYIEACLWSSYDEDYQGNETNFDDYEPSSQLLGEAYFVCASFYNDHELDCNLFFDQYQPKEGTVQECLGHDLWLTSAGHGVGFWDRGLDELGERLTKASKMYAKDAYLGDDGLVYLA